MGPGANGEGGARDTSSRALSVFFLLFVITASGLTTCTSKYIMISIVGIYVYFTVLVS